MVISHATRSQIADLLGALTPVQCYRTNGVLTMSFREILEPVRFEYLNEDAINYVINYSIGKDIIS